MDDDTKLGIVIVVVLFALYFFVILHTGLQNPSNLCLDGRNSTFFPPKIAWAACSP